MKSASAALTASVLAFNAPSAEAQTVVSTELTAPRTVDLSVEFLGSVARRTSGGFEWYLTDLTFGVAPRLEVGAGWSALVPAAPGEPHEVIPHGKLKLVDRGWGAVAVGAAWHVPVSHRDDARGYGWVYAAVSRTFDASRPITVSGGVYELVRRDAAMDDTRRGVSLGWEQTLTDRWSWSLDWISGRNWYGYLSPGMTFSAGPSWVTGGYCVGNERAANHGPCVSAGRTF